MIKIRNQHTEKKFDHSFENQKRIRDDFFYQDIVTLKILLTKLHNTCTKWLHDYETFTFAYN